jgi:outer membrane protein TolC
MKPAAALCLAILAAWPAARPLAAETRATAPASGGLTLADAQAMLLERNLALAAARRGVEIARAQRLVADTAPAGSITYGQTAAQMSEERRLSGFYGNRAVSPLNNASFTLNVVVERGGKRELRTLVAAEQVSVAEAQLLDAMRDQLFQLRQAFINALQARADLRVALDNRNSLNQTEALLARQVRQGGIAESELLRFQASRLPFEQQVAAAIQAQAAAVARVAALLGQDAVARGATLELGGSLANQAPLGLTQAALAAAIGERPDVLAAERGVAAADASTRLAEAGRSRDLSIGGSLSRTELSQDLPSASRGLRANNAVGITLSVPIFTQRITEGGIAVAMAQRAQARAQADGVRANALADLAAAWAGYEQARTLMALTSGAVLRRAEEAYRATEAAYLAGGRNLLDVLDALRTLNATRQAANAAQAAHALALATLEQASGVGGIMPRL